MFSVTPEPIVSKPAYDPQAKPTRSEQPSPDGFAALVDSNAAAASEPERPARPAPDVSSAPRRDQRDARRNDAPTGHDRPQADAANAPASDDSNAAQQKTDPAASADAKTSGDKATGKEKTASSETKIGDASQEGDSDAPAVTQVIPAIVANPVAVVIVTAADPAATTAGDAASGTTAAAAAIASVSALTAQADGSVPQPPAGTTTTGTDTAAKAELTVATVETDAPETSAATISAAANVIKSDSGKTEVSAKTTETASTKDGKDSKQALDSSSAKPVSDQAIAPDTGASSSDDKPAQHDKAASESGTADTETSKHGAKATPQGDHRGAVPAPQHTLQTDPGLQTPIGLPQQPVQTHAANLTAIPVAAANTPLADSAPVPLNGLAADIALRAAGGNSRFEIRLDPAELGRIDVRLDVDKHGNVTSHLTVERPATLDMLRRDAPQLQQALEDAGLKTGDSGLQFSLRDQSSSGQNNDHGSGRHSQRVVIADEDTVPAQIAGRTYGRMLGSSGGVDIRI